MRRLTLAAPLVGLGLTASLASCGGAQRPAAQMQSAPPSAQCRTPERARSITSTGSVDAAPAVVPASRSGDEERPAVTCEPPSPALDETFSGSGASPLELRIDEAWQTLSTAGADCGRVCPAVQTLCEAAREVCEIVSEPHPRCARARLRCTDASRTRESSCPVCPAPR